MRLAAGTGRIYSHELAALAAITAALVRRDLMTIGFTGSPARGYDVKGLIERIDKLLNPASPTTLALVGLGALGRAILKYFGRVHPELPIVAAFDVAPEKVGRVIDGCQCHHICDAESWLRAQQVAVGIVTVPAEAAQGVADLLVRGGVRGILNFAPVRLRVPPRVFVEDVDIAVSLEKVVFFARPENERVEAMA